MWVLRIEHAVPDFDGWKRAFDDDPVGRKKSGVRRHRVLRDAGDPNYVMIDLDFDTREQAETLHSALKQLWGRVQPEGLIGGPQARIAEVFESKEY